VLVRVSSGVETLFFILIGIVTIYELSPSRVPIALLIPYTDGVDGTPHHAMLTFSHGNSKLSKDTLIFSLPAGKTCPGAMFCKSFAVVDNNGKRKIVDGPHTEFRCFAASSEVQYDAVFNNRANNLRLIVDALQNGTVPGYSVGAADLIHDSIIQHRTKNTKLVRIHESGDFFSGAYLDAWITVAQRNPDLKFYCYSKSLQLFLNFKLPTNFYLTASYGGKFDYLIDEGYFPRYSKVVMNDDDAARLGLEVDHDDSHCFGNKPFALLVHGTQIAGSEWGKAIRERRKNKKFSGYSNKKTVTV